MKKIFFSVILIAAGLTLAAQEAPIVYRVTTIETNPAYSVPTTIRTSFETTNPGVTVLAWEPMHVWDPSIVWWRASYNTNNRITHVYYNSNGMNYSYNVSLPVLQTFVPEDVVATAINLYGNNLYGITKMKSANDMEVYQVRFLENGNLKSVWVDGDGASVIETDVYKIKIEDDEMKIKTDDKTKVKVDDM